MPTYTQQWQAMNTRLSSALVRRDAAGEGADHEVLQVRE